MAELTPDQLELLQGLADAVRRVPKGQPKEFLASSDQEGSEVLALAGHYRHHGVSPSDLEELADQGLVRITERRRYGDLLFSVTNRGMQVAGLGSPAALVERRVRFVQDRLPEPYRLAQDLMDQAASRLSDAHDEHDYSEIGHKCREAMQEFAEQLYQQVVPASQQRTLPKDKTVDRTRAVLETWKPEAGDTTVALLDALLVYWGAVSDLGHKVEHRSQKAGRPLTLQDAERAVLYTYLVMAELAGLDPSLDAPGS
ncbi:hypothetical protein [Limnochorda pilosa]|uniref:Abortive infection protein-like C-terminal domain-containing protein n=1 Tax=Limnochorda pilosa TaxID=1555112 RepID=A0A0K2SQG8_LIMPI|nr:hypothetical protein [Limnochorda pilosa]BAS29370.1 hypothetical protein LIP_3559 [Limnochorda pilosa]